MTGGKHVFVPKFIPVAFLEAIDKFKVTHALVVPTMISMVLALPNVGNFKTDTLKVRSQRFYHTL